MVDKYVLGVNLSHDASAALLCNGKLVCAIAEERLNRVKHCSGGVTTEGTVHNLLPILSIQYCIDTAAIDISRVDLIVVSSSVVVGVSDYSTRNLTKEEVLKQLPKSVKEDRVEVVGHHLGHAASAFYPSGFSEAVVIVADGGGCLVHRPGDVDNPEGWYEERTSVYRGVGNELDIIDQFFDKQPSNGYLANEMPCSLGDFYQSATQFIGFGPGNEGKTMGLAPYGSDRFFSAFAKAVNYKDGSLSVESSFQFNKKIGNKNSYNGSFGLPHAAGLTLTACDKDIAAAVQYALEEVLVEIAADAYKKTNTKYLCLAGGIALNSVANKIILDRTPFEQIFVQPASGDDGCALGNALIGWRHIMAQRANFTMVNAYTGKTYTEAQIETAISDYGSWIKASKPVNILEKTSELIASQHIVGWFQEGSEFGPRSLGHRSILCDPRHPDMKDILNRRVKHREAFRPFAPSILAEFASDFFELEVPSPYMLLIAKVLRPEVVPAITHVDGTGRVQTVTKEANGIYHALIQQFHNLTGVPVLLNTSFNDNEEPIVETPTDAIRCFLKTNIDYLVIGDQLVEKKWMRCKILRIWPNDFKRWSRRKGKYLNSTFPLFARLLKLLRSFFGKKESVHVRMPG